MSGAVAESSPPPSVDNCRAVVLVAEEEETNMLLPARGPVARKAGRTARVEKALATEVNIIMARELEIPFITMMFAVGFVLLVLCCVLRVVGLSMHGR